MESTVLRRQPVTMAPPLLQSAVVVRLDVGGTPLSTSLATVMEGARQGSEVSKGLCAKVGSREPPPSCVTPPEHP
jgi:hypothetical protein